MLARAQIDRVVAAALEEDAPWGDVTSAYLIPEDAVGTAELVAREAGVFSGADVFTASQVARGPMVTGSQASSPSTPNPQQGQQRPAQQNEQPARQQPAQNPPAQNPPAQYQPSNQPSGFEQARTPRPADDDDLDIPDFLK